MKQIIITISGPNEEGLTDQIVAEAARSLTDNWSKGCGIRVEELRETKTMKALELPSFMMAAGAR